jgi:SAM-dependent methyltransferase
MLNKAFQLLKLWCFRFNGRLKARLGIKVPQFTADRIILEQTIFPFINQSENKLTLFVGVDFYTKHYCSMFEEGLFWTIDFNSRLKAFGSKNHICDRYENIGNHIDTQKRFDFIICNGLIGYGTNSIEDLDNVLSTSYRLLNNNGLLIVGWNNRPHVNQFDPRKSNAINFFSESIFLPLGTSRYKCDQGSTHVYDFYKKNSNLR